MRTEKATFAAGCFWGVEAAFRQVPGVLDAVSGYTGGHTQNPTYREVCSDATGHAEAVEVTFDSDRVSYDDLLRVFWQIHDPTTPDRQGPDVGSQYRSSIFVHDAGQRERAQASLREEQQQYAQPIVTAIADAARFYPAEAYHQRYFEKHGVACHVKL
ncbi:MAG TPA: peptide-methionine (S)-S-oxide reductase MsrA [Candidatus Baltobacteraceae bacterium]